MGSTYDWEDFAEDKAIRLPLTSKPAGKSRRDDQFCYYRVIFEKYNLAKELPVQINTKELSGIIFYGYAKERKFSTTMGKHRPVGPGAAGYQAGKCAERQPGPVVRGKGRV
jgi:hypothetical protein